MKTVAYIHGLNQTSRCFGYVLQNLPEHDSIQINYDSHQPLSESIRHVISQLPLNVELSLVGHSLGGLISTLIAHDLKLSELVIISAPIGGSKAAKMARWFPGAPSIIRDITPTSPGIVKASTVRIGTPTLSICSTSGDLPGHREPNDGIVAIESQKALPFGKKAEVQANHFEVLMHDRTVELIRKHLFGSKK